MSGKVHVGPGDVAPHNPARRVPCVVLLDTSESMREISPDLGRPAIDALNEALPLLRDDLYEDDEARMSVELAVVTFGGMVTPLSFNGSDWTNVDSLSFPTLTTSGNTPLAQALRIGLDLIEMRKLDYRAQGISYYCPWMFILTDGAPTDTPDDWTEATRRCRDAATQNKVLIWTFSTDTSPPTMARMHEVTQRVFKLTLSKGGFRELFLWLSSSLKAVSQSQGAKLRIPTTPSGAQFDPFEVPTT